MTAHIARLVALVVLVVLAALLGAVLYHGAQRELCDRAGGIWQHPNPSRVAPATCWDARWGQP